MSEPLRQAKRDPKLDLGIGAAVVYGGYGVGRVSARSTHTRGDAEGAMVVLEFKSDLLVILPLQRAEACLRSPASRTELEAVGAALTTGVASVEQSWHARTRTTRAKIALGEPVGLAEIVHDAVRRQRQLTSGSLSSIEQELYEKARSLLAGEVAVASGIDDSAAQTWITDRLERGVPAPA